MIPRPVQLALRFAAALLLTVAAHGSLASELVRQRALPGACIPRFAVPLPVFGPGPNATLPRVDAAAHPFLTVTMQETEQQVLPPYFLDGEGCPDDARPRATRLWTYETRDLFTGKLLGPALWPAVTLDARRGLPTLVRYVNALPAFDPSRSHAGGLVQGLISVDRTIHWASPGGDCAMAGMPAMEGARPRMSCFTPYVGPPPAITHLHGGEVPSEFDGNPDAWFTPTGQRGPAYHTLDDHGRASAVFWYPNAQGPGTLWFHDHAMGMTRTNVYSGLEGFYLLRDPRSEPTDLPQGAYEIELAVQDRQFDTKGQLYFPDGSGKDAETSNLNGTPPNPEVHPFWVPEFAGDVVVVNGAPWPFLDVEPRRYRFRILDGSNARFYRLDFGPAKVFQIGADEAYLDAPVRLDRVFVAPGERADLIVDFTGLEGKHITVKNDARVPYPDGLEPGTDQPGLDRILQFRVTRPLAGRDRSCDPAGTGCGRPTSSPTVRLADGRGSIARGVKVDRVRQLVLKETESDSGPLEVLVNNSKYEGMESPSIAAEFPRDGVSELPRVGSTEIWEIANLTMDAHPMHVHLVQFQLIDRRPIKVDEYLDAYGAAFGTGPVRLPAGCERGSICPGYGPPLRYGQLNADGALGGNPAFGPFLDRDDAMGPSRPPAPEESGWKDTAKAYPGEVLRLALRWAPTDTAVASVQPGWNRFPFDPTSGPGYVWHCHIIDHEDNEMMRPYRVVR